MSYVEPRPAPGQPYGRRASDRPPEGPRSPEGDGVYVSASDVRALLSEHSGAFSSDSVAQAAARLADLVGEPCPACGRRGLT